MILDNIKGWIWQPSGANSQLRVGKTSETMVSDAMPRYYDACNAQNTFYAANQVATAWSVALATTYTGLVVSNPAGSNVNLIIKKVSFALSIAPVAISHLGIFGGYVGAGITTHTTPLIPGNTFLGGKAGKVLADGAAILVGTPAWIIPFMGGFTAAALPSTSPSIMDLEGSVIVPPGGYIGIGALTAVTGFGGFIWDEVPIT